MGDILLDIGAFGIEQIHIEKNNITVIIGSNNITYVLGIVKYHT